jgi:hypothetical protein
MEARSDLVACRLGDLRQGVNHATPRMDDGVAFIRLFIKHDDEQRPHRSVFVVSGWLDPAFLRPTGRMKVMKVGLKDRWD